MEEREPRIEDLWVGFNLLPHYHRHFGAFLNPVSLLLRGISKLQPLTDETVGPLRKWDTDQV